MSCHVIYYKDGAKMMRPIQSREEYLALRDSEKQKEVIKQVRGGLGAAKMGLVQMNYSLSPALPQGEGEGVPLKGCKVTSNTVGMDIDHIKQEEMQEVKDRILARKDELGLLMLELSARGEGFHLVFKRKAEMSQEENLRWASDLLGVKFDSGAKDITRVFFTTTASPEDLLFLDDGLFGASPSPSQGGGQVDTVKQEKKAEVKPSTPITKPSPLGGAGGGSYMGTPYATIIKKYWEMFNDGQEPVEGNRNVLTYELAMTIRPICDYSLEKMMQVIPNFWGEDGSAEWKKTIENALAEPRKSMPYRLRQVLKAVKDDMKMQMLGDNPSTGSGTESGKKTEMPQRPKRMPGFMSLVSSKVPMKLKAMVEESIWPALCAHLHGVKFQYIDGVLHEANICSALIARQSSGKGRVNEPIECLLKDISMRDEENKAREKEWRRRNQGKGQSKDRQPRPEDIVIQRLDDDLTSAALAQSLIDAENNGGRRIITKVDEIELLNKVGNGRNDTVALLVRYGFDAQRFGQRRVGLESVNGSYTVRWVWNASCTPKSAMRFINRNWITDGTLSRLNINALLIPKEDHEMPKIGSYDDAYQDALKPYIDRLNAASGLVECPQANKLAEELKVEHDRVADLCESEGYRTFCYRAIVIGWLKANILYIMNGYKWDKQIADYVRYSVRRDMWLKMYYFGEMIEEEFEEEEKRQNKGPRNLLESLPNEFTYEQYLEVRKQMGKTGDGKSALRVWKNRGYIEYDDVTNNWIKRYSVTVLQ